MSAKPPPGLPDPTPIFQLATGYWASATLLAANDLGLFRILAATPTGATIEEVAAALAADPRGTELLLQACGGLGLVRLTADKFALTPVAAAYLVPGQPGYLGSALRWSRDQYAAWGQLAAATRTGKPAVDPAAHLGDDPAQTRAFVLGMHERAQGVARGVVPFIDLRGCHSLLDVGGGPGTYAVLLAQQYPQLHVTVLDLDAIIAVAQDRVEHDLAAQPALLERLQFQPGDATSGEYGGEHYDAVLFSGVLHQMNPATCQLMLDGAHRALKPHQRVFISDLMLDAGKTQPVFAALFSLQMLLTTDDGAVFSVPECEQWLRTAQFTDLQARPLPPPLPYTVISAQK